MDVADYLGLDVKTARTYYRNFSGKRLNRNYCRLPLRHGVRFHAGVDSNRTEHRAAAEDGATGAIRPWSSMDEHQPHRSKKFETSTIAASLPPDNCFLAARTVTPKRNHFNLDADDRTVYKEKLLNTAQRMRHRQSGNSSATTMPRRLGQMNGPVFVAFFILDRIAHGRKKGA